MGRHRRVQWSRPGQGRPLHHRPGSCRSDQRRCAHINHLPWWSEGCWVPLHQGGRRPRGLLRRCLPLAHAGVYYGKREAEAEPWTVGQIAAGAHVAEAIKDGRAHNVGVITNAAIAPVAATHVYSAYPYAPYPVAYYGKREAEADPALVYSTGLVGAYPYAVGAHAVTYAGAPHAVAHTPFGVTHSSNVGICTNVKGAVVPCRRKREADPALIYSTVGAVPYTYGVLPYAGVHGTNPVHAVAHTAAGLTHSSNVGICTNYVGAVVPC